MTLLTAGQLPGVCWWDLDFDGSGAADFDDFFLFADHFGTREGDPGWDAAYDLDSDGAVTLEDFFVLADGWPDWRTTFDPDDCGDGSVITVGT